MVTAATPTNRMNGASIEPPRTGELFSPAEIKMQRQMRVNPLPMLNPSNLGLWLDQFDIGMLRAAAMVWDAMCKRDDTLITVKPQLENAIASKDWGIFRVEGADEVEAARHEAALEYFYGNLTATDAFDRNERGGQDKLLEQMARAESFFYAPHHIVYRPMPGKMIEVEGAAPVPALTATFEYVPLWYFENTTGQLRFLKDGGFGVDGEALDWANGEWMVTTGRGLMFAASICYTFKRLTFQDWTIFNERYASPKVIGMTPASETSPQGQAMATVIANFNGDQGIALYESQVSDKPPISLLGPEGTVSVEIFEKFVDRQDRKMSAMYRGGDLSTQSRGGQGEKPLGASLQGDEGDAMEKGACRRIAGVCQEFIDRQVIRFCFGEGVEPLAYFGLPDMDVEDTKELRESAGFLADRGVKVSAPKVADRLGVELVSPNEKEDEALEPIKTPTATGDSKAAAKSMTVNAAPDPDLEKFLGPYKAEFVKAFAGDMQGLRSALEHVVQTPNEALQRQNMIVLRGLLPSLLTEINRAPKAADVLADLMKAAFERGVAQVPQTRSAAELAATTR
jgi:phage gp29-like protein